jgi:hypothetical protein
MSALKQRVLVSHLERVGPINLGFIRLEIIVVRASCPRPIKKIKCATAYFYLKF